MKEVIKMIAVLSPAMNMGYTSNNLNRTTPIFINKTNNIVEILKGYNPFELEEKLGLSTPKLVEKTFNYYESFEITQNVGVGTQAILSFQDPDLY